MILNDTTRAIFEDIDTVKRLETVIEIFTLCAKAAFSYQGNGVSPIQYNDEFIARPLKEFIADHVQRLQLGIASYSVSLVMCGLVQKNGLDINTEIDLVDIGAQHKISMEELCRKSADTSIKRDNFSIVALAQANRFCFNLDVAWKKQESIRQLEQSIDCQSDVVNRMQMLLAAHSWMYEEILVAQQPNFIPPLCLTTTLIQMRGYVKGLTGWRASIAKMHEEIRTFVTAINQRLRWAVGANPSLQNLLTAFTDAIRIKCAQYDRTDNLVKIALENCNAILHYESMRIRTKDALESDQQFLNLVSQWEKSCMMAQSCATAVTPVEEALVELLDPEGPIDHTWLSNVAGIIDEMTDQVQHEIGTAEKTIINSQDILHNCSHKLRSLMSTHHRMATDVRGLLRSTLKVDGVHTAPIKDYLKKYKDFLDTITELHGHVLSKDFTEEVVDGTLEQIARVLNAINEIFDDLFLFENDFKESLGISGSYANAVQPFPVVTEDRDVASISPLRKVQKGKLITSAFF